MFRFGNRIVSEIDDICRECERNPPYLRPYDAWGRRVEGLITSSAWARMKNISAEEGLVAIGYEKRFGEFDRLYQFAKLYLYAPSAGLYTCPLAACDGAAKVLKETNSDDHTLKQAFARLTSRDPEKFWTSGQWMTEKRGGSDVGKKCRLLTDSFLARTDLFPMFYNYQPMPPKLSPTRDQMVCTTCMVINGFAAQLTLM